jgi:hypothetical protein
MSRSDNLTLLKSMVEDTDHTPFIERDVLYVNDSNNASYNGNITFDTTVLSNSGKFLDYSEATFEIPLTIALKSSVDITATAAVNAYICGLKNGTHHLIDSLQVDYMNKNVVQSQSYLNFFVNYKILSTWSEDDVKKYGDLVHVHPDGQGTVYSAAGTTARGNAFSNNKPYPDVATARVFTAAAPLEECNDGFRKRIEIIAKQPSGIGGLPTNTTAAQKNVEGLAYFTNDGGAAAARIYYYHMIAVIRLKDVCDLFSKMPIVRGAQLRFTLFYNSARFDIVSAADNQLELVTSPTMLSGRTVPFMIASAEVGNPFRGILAGTTSFECNIRQTTSPASAINPLLSSCRLTVPAFQFAPEVEAMYLSKYPSHHVLYNDIYMFPVTGTTSGASFNSILTNGILDPQELLIVPVIAASSNDNTLDDFKSPFSACPGSTTPGCGISQLQVLLSGKAIFQQPVNYLYENYQYEVSKTGLSGGIETGDCSGLISALGFEHNQKYYVVDLKRRTKGADKVPLSVQVSGVNNSSVTVDYYCFITYQRSLTIEAMSGAIV